MPLNDFAIRAAKPQEKPYEPSDGEGLHLAIQPNGSKLWRMKYRFAGKENLLSFKQYPIVGIADARAKRLEAKKLLADGMDPSLQKSIDRREAETAARRTLGQLVED